jgi:hypothetical protein
MQSDTMPALFASPTLTRLPGREKDRPMRTLGIAALALLTCQPVAAQVIEGRTLDATHRGFIASVLIMLRNPAGDSVGAALSDREGNFRIVAPEAGSYSLATQRLGYADVKTSDISVRNGEEVTVEVLLGADPVQLAPLTVTSRRGGESGLVATHRRRADWIQRTGIGKVITRSEIEARPRPFVTDYLYTVSGLRVVGTGANARVVMRGCAPSVFVDGVRSPGLSVNTMSPDALEGIEIYRSVSEIPAELRGIGNCGAIAMWTRPGERNPGKWTLFQKIFAAAGGAALTVLLITQF